MTKRITAPARRTPPPSLRAYLVGPPPVSQRALAEAIGCNQSMISMLARGKRVPSAGLAVKLHAVTGVPLKALLATKIGKTAAKATPPPRRRRPLSRGDPALGAAPVHP